MVRLEDLDLRDFILALAYGEGATRRAEQEARDRADQNDLKRRAPGTKYSQEERFFPGAHRADLYGRRDDHR